MSVESMDTAVEVLAGKRVCVLAGAGISTESGIPDYRGPGRPARSRPPIEHRDFVRDPGTRRRYWARAVLGWPSFRSFSPNPAHHALVELERGGATTGLITQNVDRLHHKAGQRGVVELHGALHDVVCLSCQAHSSRDELQARLLELNPGALDWAHSVRPDGDAELPDAAVDGFVVPPCLACGGVLKPDVVFFGDVVPRRRVDHAFTLVDEADALLVVGTSLAVYSGYRFVLRAAERGQTVVVLNLGPTRADAHAAAKVEAPLGQCLPALVRALL